MEQKNIIRRSLGFMIDKLVVLGIFFIFYILLIYFGPLLSLGSYYALLGEKPSSYKFYDKSMAVNELYGNDAISFDLKKWKRDFDEVESQPELIEPFKGKTLNRDLLITGFLVIVTVNYYLLCEWLLSASLGKTLCGLRVVSENKMSISPGKVLERNLVLLLFIVITVTFRFVFDISYCLTITLF